MKKEEEIMNEFVRTHIIADHSYLRGLLFCINRNDLKTLTNEHILEIVKIFKEELKQKV